MSKGSGAERVAYLAWGLPMHEMTLAVNVLQIVEEAARRESLRRVRAVWLEIGKISSVEPEAMRFCFDAVTRDSVAEGARLEILTTAGAEMRVIELEAE